MILLDLMRTGNGQVIIARAVFRFPIGETVENAAAVGITGRRPAAWITGTIDIIGMTGQVSQAYPARRGAIGGEHHRTDGDGERHRKHR